ncbi:MAG TPA: DUF6531 domain-containing protein, partial [Vicinamibacterales bacterium]|nr:DUF6531 domain-containing protein [Vicinamibacterales bacterium]
MNRLGLLGVSALALIALIATAPLRKARADNAIPELPTIPVNGPPPPPELETITVHGHAPPNGDGLVGIWSRPRFDDFGHENGSGGRFNGNRGENEDVTDASAGDGPCGEGSNPSPANPIVLSTGNKVEPELDFESTGEMPLTLRRTYNHFWKYVGLFGKHWVSSFDYSLVWQSSDAVIFAQRPDGRRIKFLRVGLTNRWNEDKPSPVAYIVKNGDGTYTHNTEDNAIEKYDGGGKPLQIKNPHGIGWTFSYAADHYPSRITHTSGRFVQLGWTAGQLTAVIDAAGATFIYAYTANAFGPGLHRLASAKRLGVAGDPTTTVSYFYENGSYPGGLTGKAYDGVRYSTFAYDGQARAIKSEHGVTGIDRFVYAYTGVPAPPPAPPPDPPPPGSNCNPTTHQCPLPPVIDGSQNDPAVIANAAQAAAEDAVIAAIDTTTSVLETNPLGLKTTYTFLDGRLDSVSGQATAYCPARSKARSYDANGNEDLVTDFNGVYTDYTYNAKGQITQKIEAYNTAVARTTTYVWDATYNRLISETVAGDHQTSYTYTADQRLASVTVRNLSPNGVLNQAHVWTFAYAKYASGIVHTMVVDGPQAASDQITSTYAATGDLLSVSNTHGHTTTYALYDNAGRPGRVTGPNGDQTDIAYYPGGHLNAVITHPNNVAATTTFTYAGGLLATVKTPDNVTTTYTYDAARRLTKEARPELNGSAERRLAYNLGSDPTRIEIYRGVAQRYLAYIDYDEAGRIRARRGTHGQNIRYAYDKNDNLKTVTDSLNRATNFEYDALDRLITQTDARNGITRYEYDKGHRVTRITDPKNLATTYAYDGFGQLWKETSPDRGTTTFGYTPSGFRTLMYARQQRCHRLRLRRHRPADLDQRRRQDRDLRLRHLRLRPRPRVHDRRSHRHARLHVHARRPRGEPPGDARGRARRHHVVQLHLRRDGPPGHDHQQPEPGAAAVHLRQRPALRGETQGRRRRRGECRDDVQLRADGSGHRLHLRQRPRALEDVRSRPAPREHRGHRRERYPIIGLCLQRQRCDHDADQWRELDAVADPWLRRADAADVRGVALGQRRVHLRCQRQPPDAHLLARSGDARLRRRHQPADRVDAPGQHDPKLRLRRQRQHHESARQDLHLRRVQPAEQDQRRRIHHDLRRQRARRARVQEPRRRRVLLCVRARPHAACGLHARRAGVERHRSGRRRA